MDSHQNGIKKRSPVLDLNQALTKEEEDEEEEYIMDSMGPPWLHARLPQKPWLQLHEQEQADLHQQKQRTSEGNPNYLSSEQHQPFGGKPYPHAGEHQIPAENLTFQGKEQHQVFPERPSFPALENEQTFHVIDIWKNNPGTTRDLTQSFSLMEDANRIQEKPAILSSLGTTWEHEPSGLPCIRRSLSPVSPPLRRKSLSPVSPEQRQPEEMPEAILRRGRSPGKGANSYRSPLRGLTSGADTFSKRRRERDDSVSPRGFSRRRRDRSPSLSPIGRSSRVGRSRSRSPPPRGYRYSPPRSRYSPRARYSPRRRSPPLSYRPKRRPWSPPPNRNTGLGKPGRNLFIAGFSFGTTERDLEKKFSRYGHVRDVRIVRDRRSGDSRGFGFLSLDRDENADAAIRGLDQTEWNGRIVLVEKAKSPN